MRRLSDDKQNLIRKRLLQGHSVRDIAEEVQVSEKTVKRYKKNAPMPLENEDTGDNAIKYDCTTLLTKKEAVYVEKIKKEIALYEDPAEGWVYHVTKNDFRLRQSGMWWNAIAYPDSVPENWLERLKCTGLRIAISPLHDKDTWNHDSPEVVNPETGEIIPKGARYKVGDRKKAHWHIIVVSDLKVGYREMNDTIRDITHGPYIQKCRSLKNSFDYFLHINAPEKYQRYDKNEIQRYNNFNLQPSKYEQGLLQVEIISTILDEGFDEWHQVAEYYRDQPEYMTLICSRPGAVSGILRSVWNKHHPKGRVQRVKVVVDDDFNLKDKDSEVQD